MTRPAWLAAEPRAPEFVEQIRDLFMDRLRLRDDQAGACLEGLNLARTTDAVPGRRLHRAGDQGNQRAEVVAGLLRQGTRVRVGCLVLAAGRLSRCGREQIANGIHANVQGGLDVLRRGNSDGPAFDRVSKPPGLEDELEDGGGSLRDLDVNGDRCPHVDACLTNRFFVEHDIRLQLVCELPQCLGQRHRIQAQGDPLSKLLMRVGLIGGGLDVRLGRLGCHRWHRRTW